MKLETSKEIFHSTENKGTISVTVSKDTTGTVEENGRKVLKAGAFVTSTGGGVFEDRNALVTQSTSNVEGITVSDVDVTVKDAVVAMAYRGEIYSNKVNGGDVTQAHKDALPLVTFVNGGQ